MQWRFRNNFLVSVVAIASITTLITALSVFAWHAFVLRGRVSSALVAEVSAQGAPIPTAPNLKGAFIGDSGADNNAAAVLRMILAEGAQFVVHSGDFDYQNSPGTFESLINANLDPDFPYFISPGNHDTSNWGGANGYQALGKARIQRIQSAHPEWFTNFSECITDYGQKSTCIYKGLQIQLSGVPYSQFGGDPVQFDYLNQHLSGNSNIWKVCSWHEQMKKLTPGSKSDSVPYIFYDLCREKGAFIVNGHAHVYGRTLTIDNFAQFSIDPAWPAFDALRIQAKTGSETGSTFLAESDFVKQRSQARCSGWPKADPSERDTSGEGCHIWASIYTTKGISGTNRAGITGPAASEYASGALFITFNVNGDPNRAEAYFKDLKGRIIDEFTITNTGTGGGGPPGNQAPSVNITSPSQNATFAAPASISISATASDADGSVTKVEFFQGLTKLGEDTISPYAFTWNNVSGGDYTLTAKATDNQGATRVSTPVSITVTSGAAPTLSLTANPASITRGQSTQLTWTSTNVNPQGCTASGGWSGTRAPAGNETVAPQASINYVLTCTGPGGSVQKTVSVTVTVAGDGTTPTINPKLGPMKFGADADDPAIWIHPTDSNKSIMFLSDKSGMISAYNFQGTKCQTVSFGTALNNIDVRSQVDLGTGPIDVVAGNLRDAGKLAVLKINPAHSCTGASATNDVVTVLSNQSGILNAISGNSYGFTLYRRASDKALFAFDKSKSSAPIKQWRVTLENGQIRTTSIRQISDVSIGVAEGFVADDAKGQVYFAEEAKGIHKYNADPLAANLNRLGFFGNTESDITGDREGMALYACNDGSGYVLLSNQRTNSVPTRVMVYDRVTNQIVKRFETALAEGADGLEVTSSTAPGFPNGLVVMHDDAQMQYYAYDWADAAGADLKICPNGGNVPPPQCSDGLDNDGDQTCDMAGATCTDGSTPGDPGCESAADNSENGEGQNPQMTLAKQVSAASARRGDELTYTLSYTNTSAVPATDVVISDIIPTGATYVTGSARAGGSYVSALRRVQWTLSQVVGGQTGSVTFRVRIDTGEPVNVDPAVPAQLIQSPGVEGAVIQSGNPSFTFTISDPNQGQTIGYQIQISRDANFTQLAKDYTWGGSTTNPNRTTFTVLPADTLAPGPYWWRVRGTDNQGAQSAWAYVGDPSLQDVDFVVARELPPVEPGAGIWISQEEIAALPMSGAAWNAVVSAANGGWGSANLGDNNSSHDVSTLAGALVAARTGDQAMRNKTIEGLQSAMRSSLSRALELSRGLQTYIIAADIIGYHEPAFESWVREMVETDVSGHSGGIGVLGTAKKSANNWGGHARASLAAAAVYLNDQAYRTAVVNAHKAFIGVDAPNEMSYTGTSWHADPGNKAGVNRKGTTKGSVNISGVLPEDWRRAADFKWPPSTSGYMWEGMQGFVVTAVILHRAGLVPFSAGDDAVVRAMNILYGRGEAAANSPVYKNPPSGDDTWIPWVVNYYGGTNFPANTASSGKNMGWTDWTHAR